MTDKTKVIAYYLPQFHPVDENNLWWGNGFTEWTNVAKARPLFKNHNQPRIPADLGFYDLRLDVIKEQQAQLAQEAGISAFCYWHYWFGDGKQLLEKPLQDVIKTKNPNFPFCLAWANHSWRKKEWNSDVSRLTQELLIEQRYPSNEDVDNHFFEMLPMFKDERYFRIDNRLVFVFYRLEDIENSDYFIERWQKLSADNDLPGFYFIALTSNINLIDTEIYKKVDAINLELLHDAFNQSKFLRLMAWLLKRPIKVISYKNAISKWENNIFKKDNIYPSIYPDWDTSPRVGVIAEIIIGSTPYLFKTHVKRILNLISHKNSKDKVIFLKSWNEWAEGNYMEPDLKFGKGYINSLNEALVEDYKE